MYFRCVVMELWILLHIFLLLQNIYISVKTLKTLKNYAVMLQLVSDFLPMLILYSRRTSRLLSQVLSGWIILAL